MTLVVDASALVWAVSATSPAAATLRRRMAVEPCHAPHLIDAEVGNVLRRRVLRGELTAADGEVLLGAAAPLVDHRYEVTGSLSRAAWKLRENLTFYDAVYAALAQALEAPLLTCDHRLGKAPGIPCAVELVAV
ncbi:MAG TPA: type II toxin-antitoxin system VapC family toxin [Actinomycetota bacterium]|jgi:predicted nucleic acid-binding protein